MRLFEDIADAFAAFPVLALLAIALGPVTLFVLALAGVSAIFLLAMDLLLGTGYVLHRGSVSLAHVAPHRHS